MKITKRQLKKLIKEETSKLNEFFGSDTDGEYPREALEQVEVSVLSAIDAGVPPEDIISAVKGILFHELNYRE